MLTAESNTCTIECMEQAVVDPVAATTRSGSARSTSWRRGSSATCGALNRLHGELVDEIAEALHTEAWRQAGIASPEHWVKWRTGVSHAHACELVRLAHRIHQLPVCAAELREGRASLDQLDVVARHVPAKYEAQVAELASTAMVSQLKRVLSKLPYDDAGEREDAAASPRRRRPRCTPATTSTAGSPCTPPVRSRTAS